MNRILISLTAALLCLLLSPAAGAGDFTLSLANGAYCTGALAA